MMNSVILWKWIDDNDEQTYCQLLYHLFNTLSLERLLKHPLLSQHNLTLNFCFLYLMSYALRNLVYYSLEAHQSAVHVS